MWTHTPGSTATTRTPIADGRDRKILYEVNKVHQVDKTKIPGEHTATGESQHFRYQKTGAGGTQTEDGRTGAPRTFTAGVDGQNAADADSSKNSISKTGENVKGKMSAQDGRYRDLMGEKAAQYVRRLEARMVNELAENLSVPGQAKRKNSLSKNRRGNFSFARYPNNAMDKHDMFGAVHTWHPRDDSNVRPFA